MADAPEPRWYHPTPAWLLLVLLAVELLLPLSERFRWFAFNEHKGWTVLIAVAAVGVAMLLLVDWLLLGLVFGWRFRFSIRALLLLALAVAIPCGWLGLEMKRARDQREFARAIRKSGGQVDYGYGPFAEPAMQEWLREWLGNDLFGDVTSVEAHGPGFDDAAMARLKGWTQLKGIVLDGTKVGDAGMAHLQGLSQLRWLLLRGTKVGDAGLEDLKGLSQLEFLDLRGTQVTDAGLKHLEGLSRLQTLALRDTKVTSEGVKTLQKALPRCKIPH